MLRIFYKKDYELAQARVKKLQRIIDKVNKENDYLNELYKDLSNEYSKLCVLNKNNNDTIENYKKLVDLKNQSISELEIKIKELCCSKGGLVTSNNNLSAKVQILKKEIQDLRKELKQATNDKYKVIKVKGTKSKSQVINARYRHLSDETKRILKEKGEMREKVNE